MRDGLRGKGQQQRRGEQGPRGQGNSGATDDGGPWGRGAWREGGDGSRRSSLLETSEQTATLVPPPPSLPGPTWGTLPGTGAGL